MSDSETKSVDTDTPMSAAKHPLSWSVVIPTYRRIPELMAVLEDVFAQETRLPKASEVLVVEQYKPDETARLLAEKFPDSPVRVIPSSPPSAARGRNVGMAQARGEFILLLDDDMRLPPGFFPKVENYFADLPQAMMLHPTLDDPNQGGTKKVYKWLGYIGIHIQPHKQYGTVILRHERPSQPTPTYMAGSNVLAVRRCVVDWGLRFDEGKERYSAAEDFLFCSDLLDRWANSLYLLPLRVEHAPADAVRRWPSENVARAFVVMGYLAAASRYRTGFVWWDRWLWALYIVGYRAMRRNLPFSVRLATLQAGLWAIFNRKKLSNREVDFNQYVWHSEKPIHNDP